MYKVLCFLASFALAIGFMIVVVEPLHLDAPVPSVIGFVIGFVFVVIGLQVGRLLDDLANRK